MRSPAADVTLQLKDPKKDQKLSLPNGLTAEDFDFVEALRKIYPRPSMAETLDLARLTAC